MSLYSYKKSKGILNIFKSEIHSVLYVIIQYIWFDVHMAKQQGKTEALCTPLTPKQNFLHSPYNI